jgi:hypothetical protein
MKRVEMNMNSIERVRKSKEILYDENFINFSGKKTK